jgi:tetrahydromethanopterin:alpha-L-glutamate ligase
LIDSSTLRIGVIGTPGNWSTDALVGALAARTGFSLSIDMGKVSADLVGAHVWYGDIDLCALDGLAVKKVAAVYSPDALDRLELLRFVESRGVRIFSRPGRIARLIDRLACTVTLREAGIPMPSTVVTEDPVRAVAAVRAFGTAILKPLYSTKARGMVIIDAASDDVEALVEAFRTVNRVMYIQQKIAVPGMDLGIAFLGGRHVGTYARVIGGNAWNTTIHSGGRYAPHDASEHSIALACRAQEPFGLDFTTVDVVETGDGPMVFEVSAFGGFSGLKAGTGIDAAALYADYIVRELST